MVEENHVHKVTGDGWASVGGFCCRCFIIRGTWPREGHVTPKVTWDMFLMMTPLGFLPYSPCTPKGFLGGSEGPRMQTYEVLKISSGEIVRNFY